MISFITFTRNSAKYLPSLLENVSDVVDEIVIIDGYSTDNTLEIAKMYNAKVYQRKPWGYVEPDRMYALSKASYEWILYLDTDERLGKTLKKNLRSIISSQGDSYDAFSVTRINILKGKPLLGPFYPDRQIRIFRKTKTVFKGIIHEIPSINGKVLELPEDHYILHYGPHDLKKWKAGFKKFAWYEALQYYKHEGFFVRRVLWVLAPFSMPLIYLYIIARASIKGSPMNYLSLKGALYFAFYEALVHTLTKIRDNRRRLLAAIIQRCGFTDLIESRERGEDLITFIYRCLANKT